MLLADAAQTWIDLATQSGPVAALLAIIIYGGFKRSPWWVFGWVYRDLERRHHRRGEQLDKWWEMSHTMQMTAETLAKNRMPTDPKRRDA